MLPNSKVAKLERVVRFSNMTSREDIAAMRRQYGEHGLIEGELPLNPIELFNTWLTQAAENELSLIHI